MIINLDNYIKYNIIIFLVISILIWIKKPKLVFDSNNNMKQFGTGRNKTIFYYPFVIFIIALISFYIFNILYLIKK